MSTGRVLKQTDLSQHRPLTSVSSKLQDRSGKPHRIFGVDQQPYYASDDCTAWGATCHTQPSVGYCLVKHVRMFGTPHQPKPFKIHGHFETRKQWLHVSADTFIQRCNMMWLTPSWISAVQSAHAKPEIRPLSPLGAWEVLPKVTSVHI